MKKKVVYLKRATSKGRVYFYNTGITGKGSNYGSDQAAAEARFAEWKTSQIPATLIGGLTLGDVIQSYYQTDAFLKDIKPRTRELYRGYAEQLRATDLARRPLDTIDIEVVRALQDALKDQPSKCYQTLAVLQTVLSHAIGRKLIKGPNPVAGIKRKDRVRSPARTTIWTPEQIDAFLAAARPSLRLAAQLLLYTAQRPSDVLALTRGQIDERGGRLFISLRQQKTGTLVGLPVSRRLEVALRERLADPGGGMMLVPSPTGLAWTRRNFSRAWDQARKRAGLPPLQRRDLRRTAVVNLALAGCTITDIASITGHSTTSIDAMLKIYLPHRIEIATAAIAKWDAAPTPKLDNVIELAASAPKRRRA